MDLYFDKATNTLTRIASGGGLAKSVEKKRGDSVPLRLHVRDGNSPVTLSEGALVRFGMKKEVEGEVLALAGSWDAEDAALTSVLNLNTEELTEAIGGDKQLNCMAELTISEDGGSTWVTSQTISFIVRNDVLKEEDAPPTPVETWSEWLGQRAVRHDVEQELTVEERSRAATNLGFDVYADLQAANAGIGKLGIPFFNQQTEKYDVTTDIE